MVKKKGINVVSLGSRDFYNVAIALNNQGMLGYLITDFYTPNILRTLLKKRFDPNLNSNKTLSLMIILLPFLVVIRSLLSKSMGNKYYDFIFGFISAFICTVRGNNAIVYSYYCSGFYSFLKLFNIRKIRYQVFQVHPTPWHVSKVLKDDQHSFQQYSEINFREEQDVLWSENENAKYFEALSNAESVMCASHATGHSIQLKGKKKISYQLTPYGSRFNYIDDKEKKQNKKFKLLTVAKISQRKGLHHAFEALKNAQDTEWVIVGEEFDQDLINLAPKYVKFKKNLSISMLINEYRKADLFIMPSIIEGFGLVYLESIAQLTPVLCSHNTGVADILKHRESAFIIDPKKT